MYSYQKLVSIGLLLFSALGILISCDFIFENHPSNSNKQQIIKDSQVENEYWVLLANNNLHIIKLCDTFLNKNITESENEIVRNLLNNHQLIKEEIKIVAELKNISIPISLINSLSAQKKQLLLSDWSHSSTFHKKVTLLLTNQIETLNKIEEITNLEKIKTRTQKIKSIVLKDKIMINNLLNFNNNYTNL